MTRLSSSAMAAVALAMVPANLHGLEVANPPLLIDLDAADYATGDPTWEQNTIGTGLPGFFYPSGTPTVQSVAGATAIVLDGKYDYFTGPPTTGTSLQNAGGPYSIEVWAYHGNVIWEEALVSWSVRGGPDLTLASFRYGLHQDYGAWASWGGAGDMGFPPAVGGAGTPPATGIWHLITYVHDGTNKIIYVDGNTTPVISEAANLNAWDGQTILIGIERENNGTQGQAGIVTGNTDIHYSGAIAKVRIHRGALTPAQINSNYIEETGSFPGLSAAAALPLPPIHRWSFNNSAGSAPDSTTLIDTIGGAPAVVRGGVAYAGTDASFTGTALSLPGGSPVTQPYVDFPNGIISKNQAITIEWWSKSDGTQAWSRLIDLGTSIYGANAGEVTAPGGTFDGKRGLWLTNRNDMGTDQEFNREGGTSPNGGLQRYTTRSSPTGLQAQYHHAVVYDNGLKEWRWFRDSQLMAVIPDTAGPTLIDDVNNWFGRSGWSPDANFQGELNEFRIFNYALSESQIHRNTLDGPDTITTSSTGLAYLWTPTTAGPFNFNNAGPQDNWNTSLGGPFPNAIDDTANLVSNLTADQAVNLNAAVTLGTLNIGDLDGSNIFTVLPGTAGSITMQTNLGYAAINQAPDAYDTFISAPLTLNTDTTVYNPSDGWLYLNNTITGSGDLAKYGTGDVFITGDSPAYAGTVQILQGTLFIGDNGVTASTGSMPAATFSPALAGRLAHNRSDNVSTSLIVTGAGSFEQRGSGSLTLGTGTSLTHTWDFDTIAGSGDLIIEGTANVNGPRNFRIENNTILRGDCTIAIGQWFSVGIGTGGSCLQQANASLAVTGDFNVGDVGIGQSLFTLEGGTVSCANFFIGKNTGTSGVMVQTGGSVTKNGGGEGRIGAQATGVYGAYYLNGGSFANVAGNFQIGASGYGLMEINGGATATSIGWPVVGRFEADGGVNSLGLLDINNGSFTATGETNWLIVGELGTGAVNVHTNGDLICRNGLMIGNGQLGDPLAVPVIPARPGTGTVNLLGGTITADIIGQAQNAIADGTLNLNGGTIIAGATNATFLEGLDRAYVRSGGVTFDSNGNDITIAQPLLEPTGAGVATIPILNSGTGYVGAPLLLIEGGDGTRATATVILDGFGFVDAIEITNPGTNYTVAPTVTVLGGGSGFGLLVGTPTLAANTGGGGLKKTGFGALYLNGANTYTGLTTVTTGTLGGTGSIAGSLSADGGTTVAPGTLVGTFSIGGNATIDGTLQCEIDGATADRLNVNGFLKITNATLDIAELNAPTKLFYIIASYGSLIPATGPFFNIIGMPVGYEIVYNFNAANQIAIVSTAATDYDIWALASGFSWTYGDPDTAPGDDYDNDGLPNQDEYAFGLDPTTGTSVSPINVPLDPAAGTFTYTRRDPALTGLTYSYEWSVTLEDPWATVVPAVADVVTPIPATVNQSVTVDLTGAPGDPLANPALFVRVRAVLMPL